VEVVGDVWAFVNRRYVMRHETGRRVVGALLLLGVVWSGIAAAQPENPAAIPPARSQDPELPSRSSYAGAGAELQTGQWKGGGGLGFLGATPDGTAFGMNGNLDYFVNDNVSIGPLLQVGLTSHMTLVGLSGQGKYWINLPGTNGRGKLALQSGVGFAHADFRQNDTSWLVPIGLGYDYTLESGPSLTATALVNFTNLHPGGGSSADVMPSLMFGVRF